MISVILTAYRRPQVFAKQLRAVQSQSVKPDRILVWANDAGRDYYKQWESVLSECSGFESVGANPNLGVWARFGLALECTMPYVCIFDDDTVPGAMWLENCLHTIENHNGLLGTQGVRFLEGDRHQRVYIGCGKPNEEVEEVDIVGHSWFFRREWLEIFHGTPRIGTPTAGEDYHFSVALQAHGIKTYVPPHPKDNPDAWGSINRELGIDDVALYKQDGEAAAKELIHIRNLERGWKPMALR